VPLTDCIHCELLEGDLLVAVRETEGRRSKGLPYTTDAIDRAKARRDQHRTAHHTVAARPDLGAAA
jgi:hypothetical protein